MAVPSLLQSSSTENVWATVWMIPPMHSAGPGGRHRGGSYPQVHSFAPSQTRTMTAQCRSDSAHVPTSAEAAEEQTCVLPLVVDELAGPGLTAKEEEKLMKSLCVI